MRTLAVVCSVVFAASSSGVLVAQDPNPPDKPTVEERLRDLEKRLQEVENERDQLRTQQAQPAQQQAAPAPDRKAPAWDDLVRSGTPLTFYGFLRLDSYYNTARANSVIVPTWVLPEGGSIGGDPIGTNDDQFALDPRLTRFGFVVHPGKIGSADVSGRVEIDFANIPPGVPESRETPRIRLAYTDLDWGEFGLLLGQDWDVYSPLLPAVNSETLMWFAGNVGDRRPQITGRWTPDADGDTKFQLETGFGMTGAVDGLDLDNAGPGTVRDGFDYGLPQFQARAGLTLPSHLDNRQFEVGVWGMAGGLETDRPINGDTHFLSWLAGTDLTIPLTDQLTLRGEAWLGQALGDARGGIAQSVNPTTGQEIRAFGGFAELWWQFTPDWRVHAGACMDNPDDGDLTGGTTGTNRRLRSLNTAGYIGTLVGLGNGLHTGLDAIYWETDWVDEGVGNMIRFDAYVQLDF